MVEEAHTGKRHYHTVLVSRFDNDIVTNRSAGLCYIADTALLRALDVIAEGEEGIRAERYAAYGIKVGSRLLCGKRLGTLGVPLGGTRRVGGLLG